MQKHRKGRQGRGKAMRSKTHEDRALSRVPQVIGGTSRLSGCTPAQGAEQKGGQSNKASIVLDLVLNLGALPRRSSDGLLVRARCLLRKKVLWDTRLEFTSYHYIRVLGESLPLWRVSAFL